MPPVSLKRQWLRFSSAEWLRKVSKASRGDQIPEAVRTHPRETRECSGTIRLRKISRTQMSEREEENYMGKSLVAVNAGPPREMEHGYTDHGSGGRRGIEGRLRAEI